MAVSVIVLIYLWNPMYREIAEGIHHLSHLVEKVYDFQSGTANQDVQHAHLYYSHEQQQVVHKHSTITVLYRLFEASDKGEHEKEGIPVEVKIDRHLVTETYYVPPDCGSIVPRRFDIPEMRLSLGYTNKLLQPPRSL